jgi:hypothetical protein
MGVKKELILCILLIAILLVVLVVFERGKRKRTNEGFQNASPAKVHYYWIVSDKRKPMVLKQIHARGKMSEQDVTFVPGIFDDNVEQTLHPNLPKGWLNTPVARLLAAHMKGIRLFVNKVSSDPNPNQHVYVCMEDDVVLHKEFEEIAQETANYAANLVEPAHIGIGYVSPPREKTTIKEIYPGIYINYMKSEYDPGGTQCIMLNYAYAKQMLEVYEHEYLRKLEPNPDKVHADVFLFELPHSHHYTIEPPAALEDYPTFGTLLEHTWNADLYKNMIQKYNRDEYFTHTT